MPKRQTAFFNVSVHHGVSYLVLVLSGIADAADLEGAIAFGAQIARRHAYLRLLLDFMAVEFDGSDDDRTEVGQFAAGALAMLERVSVAVSEWQYNGTMEEVARSAGLNVKAFTSLEPAIEWASGAG